jgi:agmatine deiminase
MITDQETNFVYFSSLLATEVKYQPFWLRLKNILDREGIGYDLLQGTKDIWCRDYMPVQVSECELVQFSYAPSYLDDDRFRHTKTNASEVSFEWQTPIKSSALNLDGGNVVKAKGKAITTERIFGENSHLSKEEVKAAVQNDLQLEELFIIPGQPYDFTGHSDGMVRFLDERRLLVNDFSQESPSWKQRFSRALENTGLEIIPFPYAPSDERNEEGDFTAKGCYINFAQVGNVILLPFFDLPEDELVLAKMKELYPTCRIFPIPSNEIAYHGGVLNCASWNVMR